MRLIWGVNILIGSIFNNRITNSVGKWTKIRLKMRSSCFKQVDLINESKSVNKVLVLPIIFLVGTLNDQMTDNFLNLYYHSNQRLQLTEKQSEEVNQLIDDDHLDKNIKSIFESIDDKAIKNALLDIAITTAALSLDPSDLYNEYLQSMGDSLGIEYKKSMLKDKITYILK